MGRWAEWRGGCVVTTYHTLGSEIAAHGTTKDNLLKLFDTVYTVYTL
jgi:hypothetical protein